MVEHANKIDVVMPDWYFMTQSSGTVDVLMKPEVTQAMRQGGFTIMPRFTNGDARGWHASETAAVLNSPERRRMIADFLADHALRNGVHGINVDLEALQPQEAQEYLEFLKDLSQRLHAKGLLMSVDVPVADEAFDLQSIGQIADAVMFMGYDQHYSTGEPGPIAAQSWYESHMDTISAKIPPSKIIAGIGAYAYDWKVGSGQPATSMSYAQAVALLERSKTQAVFDHVSGNPMFTYLDNQGVSHEVWFLDALTAWNQWSAAKKRNILGVGVWRLGLEDPKVWEMFSADSRGPVR